MHKQKILIFIAVFLGVLVLLLMNQSEGFVAKSSRPSTTPSTTPSTSTPTKGWGSVVPGTGGKKTGDNLFLRMRCAAHIEPSANCVGLSS